MPNNQRTTLGSPCSPAWDQAWIDTVDQAEQTAGHRLCGARTLDGTPCTLEPNHENGRCRYHGGFDLTGAQPGNRNAVIHGLYARGIQRCGEHCPQWAACPLPNMPGEPNGLNQLPPHKRPACPYESTQFQTALADLLATLPAGSGSHLPHLVHQVALLQVMTQRAAAAMAVNPLVESTHVESGNYNMDTAKPAAALTAYTRLAAEHRRAVNLLHKTVEHQSRYPFPGFSDAELHRRAIDTQLTPEAHEQRCPNIDQRANRAWDLISDAEAELEKRESEHQHLKNWEAMDLEYLEEGDFKFEEGDPEYREDDHEYDEDEDNDEPIDRETPRTENGFVLTDYEEKFQETARSLDNAAFNCYQRAFRLAPDLHAPYTNNPENAHYLNLFDEATQEALAPT